MVDLGFRYPLLLTGCNQAVSAIAGGIALGLGFVPKHNAPRLRMFITHLLPVAACSASNLYFGNVAYLSLSLAFIQILKVLTPAVTMALCVVLGLERLSLPLAGSVALITGGTGLATMLESSTSHFSWPGFLAFSLSVLLESVRVVNFQLLLGDLRLSQAELLVYLGAPTAVMLLLASGLMEQEGLMHPSSGFSLLQGHWGMFAASMILGACVNASTALAIRNTSSLTFKVFGCIKNVFVVLYGVLSGDALSSLQFAGYSLSVVGFVWYVQSKSAAQTRSSHFKKAQ
ncbi:hypothetical protein WJX73_010368 [Symbiochloris irregularis]|uniref:Sugar phosphate transporter domain-containing protein n=1 Tax=Symbiochloris irregularis TaxID=706552 RepID=A0AAW1PMK9_9CHLO